MHQILFSKIIFGKTWRKILRELLLTFGRSISFAGPAWGHGGHGILCSVPFSTCSLVPRINRCAEQTGWPRWGRAAWHGQTEALAAFQRERRGGMRQWGPSTDPAIFRALPHLGRLPEGPQTPHPMSPSDPTPNAGVEFGHQMSFRSLAGCLLGWMRFVLPFSTASENGSVSPESQKALGKHSVSTWPFKERDGEPKGVSFKAMQ